MLVSDNKIFRFKKKTWVLNGINFIRKGTTLGTSLYSFIKIHQAVRRKCRLEDCLWMTDKWRTERDPTRSHWAFGDLNKYHVDRMIYWLYSELGSIHFHNINKKLWSWKNFILAWCIITCVIVGIVFDKYFYITFCISS